MLSMRATKILCILSCMLLSPSHPFQSPVTPRWDVRFFSTVSADLVDAVRMEPQDDAQLTHMIETLESNAKPIADDDLERFTPLIGLYDVAYVKTTKPRDNPVGGQWTRTNGFAQRILRTRRTFQHILPTNTTTSSFRSDAVGEAVNVVSLEAFWGLMRVTVILRGDAVPLTIKERTNSSRVVRALSPLAVKALFDPPRIIFGKRGRLLNINIGPSTSVLLDTTYCDDKVRIGMGGTSGTRFLFVRCTDKDAEANEFRQLLLQKPLRRKHAIAILGALAIVSAYGAITYELRILGGAVGMVSVLLGTLLATSSGGIEEEARSGRLRLEDDAAIAKASSLTP